MKTRKEWKFFFAYFSWLLYLLLLLDFSWLLYLCLLQLYYLLEETSEGCIKLVCLTEAIARWKIGYAYDSPFVSQRSTPISSLATGWNQWTWLKKIKTTNISTWNYYRLSTITLFWWNAFHPSTSFVNHASCHSSPTTSLTSTIL